MADKEFTQICKEILAIAEKVSPLAEQTRLLMERTKQAKEATEQNAASAKSAKQKAEEILASIEKLQEKIKSAADKVENAGVLLTELNSLKEQIKTLLQSGIINDTAQSAIQTYSSNLIERKLATKASAEYGYSKIEANAKFETLAQGINTAIGAAAAAQSSAAGKLGKDEKAADSAKLGGSPANDFLKRSVYNPNSASSANSLVLRDANGDFAGRWITADHFLTKTDAQDQILKPTSEICFRDAQAGGIQNHMRFATINKVKNVLGLDSATSDSSGNTLVKRDANGDFAGRFISAGHFKLRTETQNGLFSKGVEILFRGGSEESNNYVRGASASYVAQKIGVIGEGQSWQNVTAQRAVNVTYTNTTGRPIQVFIQSQNLHQSGSFVINGISFQFAFATDYYQAGQNVSFIIPAGNTYSVDLPFSMWLELR